MNTESTGLFLIQLRKEKGLTQKEIAKLCNVSTQAVSKWERGESLPDVELLNRLSILYSVTINELLDGERKEIYIDKDYRANIISLTSSLLVFIVYFFNYSYIENTHYNQVLKGYELIFNGISGWAVNITWIVFIILVSQLIINIFIVSKVIIKKGYISNYLIISSILVIVISIFLFIHKLFIGFPQFLIILFSTLSLIMLLSTTKLTIGFDKYKEYKQYKKDKNIPKELLLTSTTTKSFFYKLTKIILILSIIFIYFIGVSFTVNYVIEFTHGYMDFLNPLLLLILINILSASIILSTYKYIGSIYTSNILVVDIILIILALLSTILTNGIPFYVLSFIFITVIIILLIATIKFKQKSL